MNDAVSEVRGSATSYKGRKDITEELLQLSEDQRTLESVEER